MILAVLLAWLINAIKQILFVFQNLAKVASFTHLDYFHFFVVVVLGSFVILITSLSLGGFIWTSEFSLHHKIWHATKQNVWSCYSEHLLNSKLFWRWDICSIPLLSSILMVLSPVLPKLPLRACIGIRQIYCLGERIFIINPQSLGIIPKHPYSPVPWIFEEKHHSRYLSIFILWSQ